MWANISLEWLRVSNKGSSYTLTSPQGFTRGAHKKHWVRAGGMKVRYETLPNFPRPFSKNDAKVSGGKGEEQQILSPPGPRQKSFISGGGRVGNALPSGHKVPLLLEKEYKQILSDLGGGTEKPGARVPQGKQNRGATTGDVGMECIHKTNSRFKAAWLPRDTGAGMLRKPHL